MRRLGASAVFDKPFDVGQLVQQTRTLIDRARRVEAALSEMERQGR